MAKKQQTLKELETKMTEKVLKALGNFYLEAKGLPDFSEQKLIAAWACLSVNVLKAPAMILQSSSLKHEIPKLFKLITDETFKALNEENKGEKDVH